MTNRFGLWYAMRVHVLPAESRRIRMVNTLLLVIGLAGTHAAGQQPVPPPSDGEHSHQTASQSVDDSTAHAGQLGAYPMNREASGTAWQPDSSPMHGRHHGSENALFMTHGFVNGGYIRESGPRGTSKGFATSMAMLMGRRSLRNGALGFRLMVSPEPVLGRSGYPLLFQTGETADGLTPLVDRQHPHDMLMELSGTWSRNLGDGSSVYVYLALAGEPPIGPPAFMHRASGADNPLAPISHHFLDSTHVSHGVATVGLTTEYGFRIEAGMFNGREPDQKRWGIQTPRFNSFAFRASANPHNDWSLQWSIANLDNPEQLHQGLDVLRMTVSATHNRRLSNGNWQTTVAWGRNKRTQPPQLTLPDGSPALDPATGAHIHFPNLPASKLASVQTAFLVETAANLARWHTIFARFEGAEKDELFPFDDPRHTTLYSVKRATAGYIFDLPVENAFRLGIGLNGSVTSIPADLRQTYGSSPHGITLFLRVRL